MKNMLGHFMHHGVRTPAIYLRIWQLFAFHPDKARVLVHINKCGGGSLTLAAKKSERGKYIQPIHFRMPPIASNYVYCITLRNPLSRAVSAYNWNRKSTADQQISSEGEIYRHYVEINHAAEALYAPDGTLDLKVHDLLNRLGHVQMGLSYYLDELLSRVRDEQIDYVFVQEYLDEDIENFFGIKLETNVHQNGRLVWEQYLSTRGAENLRRYLKPEYQIIEKLYAMGKISDTRMQTLTK